jgi:hypothetical protein
MSGSSDGSGEMKRAVFLSLLIPTAVAAQGQPPQTAVNMDAGLARMQQLESNAVAERDAQQRAYEAEQQRQQKAAAAAQQKRDRAQAAMASQRDRERRDAAGRQRSIEDQDRAYENRYKELRLKQLETQVNRENDKINADLARSKAETDEVQSKAEATRNVSKGVQKNLQDANRHWWEK